MRIQSALAMLALTIMVAGCAGRAESAPSREHPASPKAAEAPPPRPSTTLKGDGGGTLRKAAGPSDAVAGHIHEGPTSAPIDLSAPPVAYTCPHHPRVMDAEAGDCPQCGMAMEPTTSAQTSPLRARDDIPGPAEGAGAGTGGPEGVNAKTPREE